MRLGAEVRDVLRVRLVIRVPRAKERISSLAAKLSSYPAANPLKMKILRETFLRIVRKKYWDLIELGLLVV